MFSAVFVNDPLSLSDTSVIVVGVLVTLMIVDAPKGAVSDVVARYADDVDPGIVVELFVRCSDAVVVALVAPAVELYAI